MLYLDKVWISDLVTPNVPSTISHYLPPTRFNIKWQEKLPTEKDLSLPFYRRQKSCKVGFHGTELHRQDLSFSNNFWGNEVRSEA